MEEVLLLVKEGILKQDKNLRWGYTTGTCAAAAAEAALVKLLLGESLAEAPVELPGGGILQVPIKSVSIDGQCARAEVVKDAGDDPDVTHGISIFAEAILLPGGDIEITGGRGVGRVTKPGLAVPVGEPAINPVPRQMIVQAARKVLPYGTGARITISVPAGETLAGKTLNGRLGIVGGISILGTSGIVRPMSEEAYLDSLIPQIDQALALGHKVMVLTPGGMGANKAKELGFPEDAIIQTSNFIGAMLKECSLRQVEGILLFGHIGKLIKVAAGVFHTHSRVADARRETLAAHAAMCGAPRELILKIMELNTVEASIELMQEHGLMKVYESIAQWASKRALEAAGDKVRVGTVVYALTGEILGYDHEALSLGRELGWQVK